MSKPLPDPANPDSLPTLAERRDARIAARKRVNRQKELDVIRRKRKYRRTRKGQIVFLTTLPDDLLVETYEWALARYKEMNP